jgi:hypothetical protein
MKWNEKANKGVTLNWYCQGPSQRKTWISQVTNAWWLYTILHHRNNHPEARIATSSFRARYCFMSGFTSNFTTSIAQWLALCPALLSASLKTRSHRVKHTVKLQKHDFFPLMKLLMKLFSKKTALPVKLSCAKQGLSVVSLDPRVFWR